MWRVLIITGLLMGLACVARAEEPTWQTCRGAALPEGPVLSDCRPLTGVIDPQGQELWLRTVIPAPADSRPRALHLFGIASTEAWLNGRPLGANGRPGATADSEIPGRYEAALPIGETMWQPGANSLIVHLSSFHGGVRLDHPMGAVVVAPWPTRDRTPQLAITLIAAGALFAAAFGFGVIHAMRRTGSSLVLAAIAGVAALQALAESVRPLFGYLYPIHVWRVGAIWLLAAGFAVLLVSYVAGRFMPGARRWMTGLAGLAVTLTVLLPGFDQKTACALVAGVALAMVACAIGVRRQRPGARLILAWLALFMTLAIAFPAWLVDLSYFLLAAGLVLPLLMAEVVRLAREDRPRGRPDPRRRPAGPADRGLDTRGGTGAADRYPGRCGGRRLCRAQADRRSPPVAHRAPRSPRDPAAAGLPADPPVGDRQPRPRPAARPGRGSLAAAHVSGPAPSRQSLPPVHPA